MNKVIIDNIKFPYDIGCRLLKTKYGKKPVKGLEKIWNELKPMTFREITKSFRNIEKRRVGISCLGMENIIDEVDSLLVSSKSIKKTTKWVKEDGTIETKTFRDVYYLYKVDNEFFTEGTAVEGWSGGDVYYVEFKDTSTDRRYMIWVDRDSVQRTNNYQFPINPIRAIAWTIKTDVPEGNIKTIVRQGDCILIQKKNDNIKPLKEDRHLTEKEYRTLLKLES